MIGSTNSIWKVNGKYEQIVNYTMLYDYGDECADITGGWDNTYTDGGGTFTKNTDNMYLYVKGTNYKKCASTLKPINITDYDSFFVNYKASRTSTAYCFAIAGFVYSNSDTIENLGYSNNVSDSLKLTPSGTSCEGILSLDISSYSEICYPMIKAQTNNSSYSTSVYIYNCFLIKADDWQTLANIAGITATTIDDILTNSTTLLSNKEAVRFMIYQCTGDFMASAIQSSTFLTALNNSQYKTIIMANEHWAKFLSMVA